ncbi:thioesterase domain-containing protein [Shewanella fidelis]|uniref:Thioesterase domain-containing protein n=1 Tax=Shewanella fidelis TaxID=173509 RepID=A0AAW8NTE1_9GAMM|nr:thioesterase domain-containing protein [Shewanella fidelis]MDR8525515.1 thioesterase domain-containing protein [Shewanella fidelis]MDW4813166.1 thioesterase domain-containing protein [Shewanella fidelis]MDW4816954.1 thioesterase domain-containing protein [Shewanella fidelis]MDW4820113.1 thioesterase domain-containing protein [Shewanella fidelis]MDW4825631.1 thioesterase domain-containing protein [Shewanella fidelis]
MTSQLKTLLEQLQQTWHQTIPVSEFMQITPLAFDAEGFSVTAPLAPNINLHNTMFAGSIYTLMTLTGWGMLWLQQQLAGVDGDIVLADASVRYLAPIDNKPVAKVRWPDADLTMLAQGRRVKLGLEVELYCQDKLCASFSGLYVSVPKS